MGMYDLLDPWFYQDRKSLTLRIYAVTGTYHGSIIEARCEGDARRLFHYFYKGESIVFMRIISKYP